VGADAKVVPAVQKVLPDITTESTPADVIAAMRERAFSYFSEPYLMAVFEQMLLLATTGPVWDEGTEIRSPRRSLCSWSPIQFVTRRFAKGRGFDRADLGFY
jgi:hypothetical protein